MKLDFEINKMDYYCDRACRENYIEIADRCTEGILILWDKMLLDTRTWEGNIYFHKFDKHGDAKTKVEYFYTMDYLSYVLSAYKQTRNSLYKETFLELFEMFIEYIQEGNFFEDLLAFDVGAELPILGQVLLVIKAMDILGYIPHEDVIVNLFDEYAEWLMKDENYHFNQNHGLFLDLVLLHISVLFWNHPNSCQWKERALERTNELFSIAYYNDCTNNEHSLMYFSHNNIMYKEVIDFCNYYNIASVELIEEKYDKICETLNIFAHKDGSFPVIGDGSVFYGKSNDTSKIFKDLGVAVLKKGKLYVTFKAKTVLQAHAHMDISSITARYKDIDFIIDTGQFNYDRYSPLNRFLRSAAGHSGIVPLFVDGIFLKEFCQEAEIYGITDYTYDEDKSYVKGEYQFRDVKVCRELHVSEHEIMIEDNWESEKPTTMRQRFVIPKELIEYSKFNASKSTLETTVNECSFKFEIMSSSEAAFTEVQFGVAAPKYDEYETTMLLDTYVQNSTSGKIIAKITFWED